MLSTAQVRKYWAPPCQGPFVKIPLYGEGSITVKASAASAFKALNKCLVNHNYKTRKADTGAYNCRPITGGIGYSLHAYGIAADLNWQTNPYGPTLVTDMPPAMVAEIKGLRTNSGNVIFRWGGDYKGNKDAMHFEVVCTPEQLSTGIYFPPSPIKPQPEDDDMKRWVVRNSTTGEVFCFNGETLRPANDPEYQNILRFHGALTPLDVTGVGPPWYDWTDEQIKSVPKVSGMATNNIQN